MNGPFQGSRLANLRQKRQSQGENILQTKNFFNNQDETKKTLTLLQQQDSSYQPSMSFHGNRTSTRFLKGRIQKSTNLQRSSPNTIGNDTFYSNKENNIDRKPSLKMNDFPTGEMKLVLNDSPQFDRKKSDFKSFQQPVPQKRVLIMRKQQKPEPKPQVQQLKQEIKTVKPVNQIEQQPISSKNNNQNSIKQEEVEESKVENQNQLIECPEGCGRKFNRKALQKHAKACKLVFMSKRKQFNSQAKRLTSHEQAALIKQNKLQQKKVQLGKTKSKGFDKTSDNWKSASEDFRSAIKAIKKQGVQDDGKEQMKAVHCQFCQKPFAEVLLPKHLENCVKKKEKQLKQRKKTVPKKK